MDGGNSQERSSERRNRRALERHDAISPGNRKAEYTRSARHTHPGGVALSAQLRATIAAIEEKLRKTKGPYQVEGEPVLAVKVEISRYVDDHFPGLVECTLVDALGVEHMFVEKVPVVTLANLNADTSYPQPGVIACVVLARSERDDGISPRRLRAGAIAALCELVHIDTLTPWGVESTAEKSRFEVFAEQLCEINSEG